MSPNNNNTSKQRQISTPAITPSHSKPQTISTRNHTKLPQNIQHIACNSTTLSQPTTLQRQCQRRTPKVQNGNQLTTLANPMVAPSNNATLTCNASSRALINKLVIRAGVWRNGPKWNNVVGSTTCRAQNHHHRAHHHYHNRLRCVGQRGRQRQELMVRTR